MAHRTWKSIEEFRAHLVTAMEADLDHEKMAKEQAYRNWDRFQKRTNDLFGKWA